MPFTITHVSGAMESNPPVEAIAYLLEELAGADLEHPDVALSDESGWTLSATTRGRVVWEKADDDDGEPRHLEKATSLEVLNLFEHLAAGDVTFVERQPWLAGH